MITGTLQNIDISQHFSFLKVYEILHITTIDKIKLVLEWITFIDKNKTRLCRKVDTALIGEEIVKEAGKKAAKEAAEESSTQALKTAGKITGGITAGIGGLTVLWDGYNFKKGYEKSASNSPLGDELRALADKLDKIWFNLRSMGLN